MTDSIDSLKSQLLQVLYETDLAIKSKCIEQLSKHNNRMEACADIALMKALIRTLNEVKLYILSIRNIERVKI